MLLCRRNIWDIKIISFVICEFESRFSSSWCHGNVIFFITKKLQYQQWSFCSGTFPLCWTCGLGKVMSDYYFIFVDALHRERERERERESIMHWNAGPVCKRVLIITARKTIMTMFQAYLPLPFYFVQMSSSFS